MTSDAISPLVSHHLRLIGSFSAVGVVYIHSTTIKHDSVIGWASLAGEVQSLLSHNLLHVALPVFFITSSFLLHRDRTQLGPMLLALKARGMTLFVPYFLWSLLALLGVQVMHMAGFTLSERIDQGFLRSLFVEPVPGQFWYLRDLMALVVISPLLIFFRQGLIATLTAGFGLWWLWDQTPVVLGLRSGWFHLISNEAAFWFFVGVLAARHDRRFCAMLSRGFPMRFIALLGFFWFTLPFLQVPGHIAHGLSVVAGTALLFLCAPFVSGLASSRSAMLFASYGFLIFVAHYPFVAVLQAVALRLLPTGQITHLMVYMLVPAIVIATIVLVFDVLSRFLPGVVSALNGRRTIMPLSARQAISSGKPK